MLGPRVWVGLRAGLWSGFESPPTHLGPEDVLSCPKLQQLLPRSSQLMLQLLPQLVKLRRLLGGRLQLRLQLGSSAPLLCQGGHQGGLLLQCSIPVCRQDTSSKCTWITQGYGRGRDWTPSIAPLAAAVTPTHTPNTSGPCVTTPQSPQACLPTWLS